MKTLKQEEIYCSEYATLEDLQRNLQLFLDSYYNLHRLHSALGYLTPAEFEEQSAKGDEQSVVRAAKMSFQA